jgi:hypothetical protein
MKPRRALDICRAAIAVGPLIAHYIGNGLFWRMPAQKRFGPQYNAKGRTDSPRAYYVGGARLFSVDTVNALIAAGEARRDGDKVVKA